jgi:hypothetical protein
MARHEPFGRPDPGDPPDGKVVMRRGADGKLQVVLPARKLTETTEPAEKPPVGDDPRSSAVRNIPPFGAGI